MMKKNFLITLIFLFTITAKNFAQEKLIVSSNDSVSNKKEIKDSTIKKPHSPKVAAIRSAILPGLGQIYNKKYWKLPIVYGMLGVSAGVFIFNLKSYRATRFAYQAKYKASLAPPLRDSTDYFKIRSDLVPLSLESLRFYRDQYRRDIDYSALVFLICWGLNVVDAVVDAHLQSFDVSPNLSLKIKPGHSEMAGTNGLSLVLTLK
jgi:hypothetical protein